MKRLSDKTQGQGRRKFLTDAATLGIAALAGYADHAAAEPPPETRRIRFLHAPALCLAPQYLAEALLRLERFTDIEYVDTGSRHGPQVHAGCIEVFGAQRWIPGPGSQADAYVRCQPLCSMIDHLQPPQLSPPP